MILKNEKRWYVVHTYSGYEDKVKVNLEKRIELMGMKDKIFRILVPVENVIETKNKKKRIAQKKVFPGYIIVEMILTDDSWNLVRNTPGVTRFVGSGGKPEPLSDEEVDRILKQISGEGPALRVDLQRGDSVKIIAGPFSDQIGVVQEIDPDRAKVKVLITFFGRETPVEVSFSDIEKF